MNRPTTSSLALGVVGGFVSVIVVAALVSRFGYHDFISSAQYVGLRPGVFALGFVPVLVSVHTRCLAPGGGFVALVITVAYVEVTTPAPQTVGERGGHAIVDGGFHALNYAETWYVWLSFLLVAGVAEFAIRRGYALGDERLRNLPTLPLSRRELWLVVAGCSAMVGTTTMIVLVNSGMWSHPVGYGIGFAAAAVATAVPLAALLSRGIVSPFVLYSWFVPDTMQTEIFLTTDSGLHIVVMGVASLLFALLAGLELWLRSRLRGWDGGRFVGTVS